VEQEQVNEKPGQTQAPEQSAGQGRSAPTQEAAEDQSVPTCTLRSDRGGFQIHGGDAGHSSSAGYCLCPPRAGAFDVRRKANPGKVR
jgi:hypothetical protein